MPYNLFCFKDADMPLDELLKLYGQNSSHVPQRPVEEDDDDDQVRSHFKNFSFQEKKSFSL